jgi:serine/threonine protein kinase
VLHGVDIHVAAAAATLSRLGNELFDTMQSHSESGSHSGHPGALVRSQSQDTSPDEVFMEEIGSGGFAQVWRVRQKSKPYTQYARKIVRLSNRTDTEKEDLRQMVHNEHETMSKLSHDHIARVTNIRDDVESQTLNIYMHPVADMNLQTYMDQCENKSFPEEDLELMKPWFACLLEALLYAHRREICHCDLKPANILVYRRHGAPPNICLTDFGLARDFTGMEHSRTMNQRVGGTRTYLAPEARPGVERGRMADVFSLGCVFSEMLTVWSKASNTTFAQARSTDSESEFGTPDFRSHLQRVHMWLSERQTAVWQDIAFRILATATMNMVEPDPNRRWDIQRTLSSLRAASDIMNCHCHSNI